MKSVWQFINPYRISAAIALLFMLTELVVELLQPLLMAKIINEGVMVKDLRAIAIWGGVMILFSILAFVSGIFNTYYASHASQSFGYDLRKNLFQHIQSLSYSQFSIFPSGSLMTRLTNDVQQIQNTMFMLLRIMIRAPLLIIGGLLMAFLVHPSLALILTIVVPFLFLFLVFIMNKGSKMFGVVQEKLDNVNTVIGENLSGMKLIRAFLRKDYEEKRFNEENDILKVKTASVLRYMEVTMPSLLLLMNIAIVFILWFGNQKITGGSANVGEVVAIVNYATRITSALSVFSFIIMAFSRARASSARISEVLNTSSQLNDKEDSKHIKDLQGEIDFRQVSFRYEKQNTWALKNLSFTVRTGETMAILGSTGSGKSTIANLIPRLYDSTEGTVSIDGVDVGNFKQEELRQYIGIVPQEALLFTGSIKDNILWGNRAASDEDIISACRDAQIYDMVRRLPEQFSTKIGQKGVNLSGGQRQRLSIARALIRKPRILLLDDSTSALDVNTEKKLLSALKTYHSTKIIITQKISTAIRADKILILKDGEKVAEGTHEYLKKHSRIYQEILLSQNEGRKDFCVAKTTN